MSSRVSFSLAVEEEKNRELPIPAVPDEPGNVAAIRSSNAPATAAALPYREYPETPTLAVSISDTELNASSVR